MCTFSLWRDPCSEGYALFFNRDEQHTRAPETFPRVQKSQRGRRYAAPRDGARGGTWVMVNETGLSAFVLNDYLGAPVGTSAASSSRGLLPLAAADASSPLEAIDVLRGFLRSSGGPTAFAPFIFFAASPKDRPQKLHWDGHELVGSSAPNFHTTSSFAAERVIPRRRLAHDSLTAADRTPDALRRLHWAHWPESPAESPRMWRNDACTRSIIEIVVERGGIRLCHSAVDWTQTDGRGATQEVSL